MVYRAYVEKKNGLANEAQALKNELVSLLGIESLEKVRILNRYDVENLSKVAKVLNVSINTLIKEQVTV